MNMKKDLCIAKFIVDHELASIGTSNMDMRSFHLNFEVNVFLYRTESTKKMVSEYVNDLRSSKEINYEVFQKRHLGYRFLSHIRITFSTF